MGNTITIKFDKEADDEVKASVQPIFDADGKEVVMPEVFRRRIRAQMDAAKKKRLMGMLEKRK